LASTKKNKLSTGVDTKVTDLDNTKKNRWGFMQKKCVEIRGDLIDDFV